MADKYGKVNFEINLDPNEFGGAFGLPPSSHLSKDIQAAAYPRVYITPANSKGSGQFDTFQMDVTEGRQIYEKALAGYGIHLNFHSGQIPFAFLPEASLTDTLTNDYGETFLQKMTDMAGEGFGQMSQMLGAKNASQMLTKSAKALEGVQKDMGGGVASQILGAGIGGLNQFAGILDRSELMHGKVGQIINKIVANHRFDFPMIWRNSAFTQNQTLTFRFYNPRPGSDSAFKKYILGPLALLLLLAVPRSDTEYGYNWPLFMRVYAPGFFHLKAAGISNMTIVKGGDQNQVSLAGPRISTVDVRVEFIGLYNTMVDDSEASGENLLPDKPNITTYLEGLSNESSFKRHRADAGSEQNALASQLASLRRGDTNLMASKMTGEGGPLMAQEEEKRKESYLARNYATQNSSVKQRSVTNEDIDYLAGDRVGLDAQEQAATLIAQGGDFYSKNA